MHSLWHLDTYVVAGDTLLYMAIFPCIYTILKYGIPKLLGVIPKLMY